MLINIAQSGGLTERKQHHERRHSPSLPGLAKVDVTDTEIGDVRGNEGFYHYRGFSAVELAEHATFEEVWHLLVHGHLPDPREASPSGIAVAALRVLPARSSDVLPRSAPRRRLAPGAAHRTLAVGLAMRLRPLYDAPGASASTAALAVVAVTPTILAAATVCSGGSTPSSPTPVSGIAADYLRMVTGRSRRRSTSARSSSTSSRRWTMASTPPPSPPASSPPPGPTSPPASSRPSAPSPGPSTEARRAVRSRPSTRSGLGGPAPATCATTDHEASGSWASVTPVYRTATRARRCSRASPRATTTPSSTSPSQVEEVFERTLAELKPGRELHANVEFYAGVVMRLAGLDPSMFTPTFCVARMVGWTANILEQARDPKIIRPPPVTSAPPPPPGEVGAAVA